MRAGTADRGGRGLFVTLEGIDGTGKSTQARLLAERLRALGREVVVTREPGGAPGAEEIRRLLVEGDPARWSPETEILLFTAARRDHVERVIRPALARGAIVVCDRFADSTRAYQGVAGAAGRDLVDRLHALAIGIEPDLTLVLDLPPDAAIARAASRAVGAPGPREDRFERKGAAFQARLAAAFREIAAGAPERCRVIGADAAPDEVAARIWAEVAPLAGAPAP
ncbi:dTMP kinase [Limibaculum sp. FT325]|uniref:dTMP kinase n=1 Tax=Thermohalobaculum sediminis TaxID=2939436 RepID=UPI0020C13DAF|nr:dTMP kinase [Limibaculum sediminis]MCL5778993.1 dTMP kinase [Limibaculum sediminis]